MPKMDGTGPEGKGPKTGRKLGKCKKTEEELKELGSFGAGRGQRYHNPDGEGKGKRLNYNKPKSN